MGQLLFIVNFLFYFIFLYRSYIIVGLSSFKKKKKNSRVVQYLNMSNLID